MAWDRIVISYTYIYIQSHWLSDVFIIDSLVNNTFQTYFECTYLFKLNKIELTDTKTFTSKSEFSAGKQPEVTQFIRFIWRTRRSENCINYSIRPKSAQPQLNRGEQWAYIILYVTQKLYYAKPISGPFQKYGISKTFPAVIKYWL